VSSHHLRHGEPAASLPHQRRPLELPILHQLTDCVVRRPAPALPLPLRLDLLRRGAVLLPREGQVHGVGSLEGVLKRRRNRDGLLQAIAVGLIEAPVPVAYP
jgi:hypothetical protein